MSTNMSTQPSWPNDLVQRQQHGLGPCGFCRGNHNIDNCKLMWDEKYYSDGLMRRKVFLENRLCFNCGQTGHSTASCPHPRASCIFCHKLHRSELHVDNLIGGTTLGNNVKGNDFPKPPNESVNLPNAFPVVSQGAAPSMPSTAAPMAASPRMAPLMDLDLNARCLAAPVMSENLLSTPLEGDSTAAPVAA